MTKENLIIQDRSGDEVVFSHSFITGNSYVAVNGGMQVRIEPQQHEQVAKFFNAEPEPVKEPEEKSVDGVFYLVRQRKDNPLKLKIMFANNSGSKAFKGLSDAQTHQKSMTVHWGHTYNFFIVEEI